MTKLGQNARRSLPGSRSELVAGDGGGGGCPGGPASLERNPRLTATHPLPARERQHKDKTLSTESDRSSKDKSLPSIQFKVSLFLIRKSRIRTPRKASPSRRPAMAALAPITHWSHTKLMKAPAQPPFIKHPTTAPCPGSQEKRQELRLRRAQYRTPVISLRIAPSHSQRNPISTNLVFNRPSTYPCSSVRSAFSSAQHCCFSLHGELESMGTGPAQDAAWL